MTNSKYRCATCKDYFPAPPFRRQGLGGVCEGCSTTVRSSFKAPEKTTSKTKPKTRPAKDEVPTAVRATVLQRDAWRCRFCGNTSIHVHHINYRSEGVDHSEHNLITLCSQHHDLVHSNKRHWKPILLATIWYVYVKGQSPTVFQVERWLGLGK